MYLVHFHESLYKVRSINFVIIKVIETFSRNLIDYQIVYLFSAKRTHI